MKAHRVYVLYRAQEGSPPEPMFGFHAESLKHAESLGIGWAHYHGHQPSDYGVEEYPAFRENGIRIHDDYVDHESSRLLNFYILRSIDDSHPLRIESHLVSEKLTPEKVRRALKEVAKIEFYLGNFITLSKFTTPAISPLFGLAAMNDDELFVIPSRS